MKSACPFVFPLFFSLQRKEERAARSVIYQTTQGVHVCEKQAPNVAGFFPIRKPIRENKLGNLADLLATLPSATGRERPEEKPERRANTRKKKDRSKMQEDGFFFLVRA
nr:hypothetical protein [Pandoravirus aubagnensis]